MFVLYVVTMVVICGCQHVSATSNSLDTEVTAFLDDHAEDFLKHMKSHFDRSLEYLFTGNAYEDQSFQRPGMGKLLRSQSDHHWELGIGALKKYLQRGGRTFTEVPASSDDFFRINDIMSDMPAPASQEVVFRKLFNFQGQNTLQSDHKVSPDFSATYLAQLRKLTQDSKSSAAALNNLHRMTMHRKKPEASELSPYDSDMAHYLEEKMEEEVGLLRKFSNMYTNLVQMVDLGMALHFFDQSLQ